MRKLLIWCVVLTAMGGASGDARGDVSHVLVSRADGRGSGVHAVPLTNHRVRMAAERVVLVPYYYAKRWQPRMLCHVWYDLVNEGPRARLQVGFPELQALYSASKVSSMTAAERTDQITRSWRLPTIQAFRAWQGSRSFAVRTYPGVGRYRRWFTFGLDLAASKTFRLHNTYLATLGKTTSSVDADEDDPREVLAYFLHYVLHTGARWRGAIGRGEVYVYDRGRLRRVRQWTHLEPTTKDDIHLKLGLTVERARTEPPEELGPGVRGYRTAAGTRLDVLRLLQASSTLGGERPDTHVGLVVDGDPETQWVSDKGRARGAYVQLPSDAALPLTGLRIRSGSPGSGRVRPAEVVVRCLSAGRRTVVATAKLPDAPGPHEVTLTKPRRCQAVRVEIRSVHGDKGVSVALAEVEQRFGAGKSTAGFTAGSAPKDPLRPPKTGLGSAKQPLPVATNPRAFEIAAIDDVSWSADGTLVHYRLHLENRRQRARGVRLGYFVDVATGKVVRAYRLDRHGELPEPYRRHWAEAMTYEDGVALLAKHGFQAAVRARRPPRKAVLAGLRLQLAGSVKGLPRALAVSNVYRGFHWKYRPRSYSAKGQAEATLALRVRTKGQPPKSLVTRRLSIDRAFAGRHAVRWEARKKTFAAAVRHYRKSLDRVGLQTDVGEDAYIKWHALTYRRPQAYQGDARVFWHPKGEAVLVFWTDQKSYSGAVADPTPEEVVPECAETPRIVCPWERRDDVRQAVAVTVHALVPRKPTTLLAPYRPPPKPSSAPAVASARSAPSPQTMAAGKPKPARSGAPKKASRGCGCTSGSPNPGLGLIVLLLGLVFVLRRRGSARGRASR